MVLIALRSLKTWPLVMESGYEALDFQWQEAVTQLICLIASGVTRDCDKILMFLYPREKTCSGNRSTVRQYLQRILDHVTDKLYSSAPISR